MCIPDILKARRFLPLFITQFLGAFNDNVFKNALVMLITYKAATETGGNAQVLVTLAAGLFILPYLLFSATAGQLADKYDRAAIARIVKLVEIGLMAVAAAGFYTNSVYLLLGVLFCMGVHSTFFGPIKYALLPQHLHENELLAGNAYVEAGTFLAILIGTISGGLLIMHPEGAHLITFAIIAIAVLGYISSRYIPRAEAPSPSLRINWNFVQETWRIIQHDRKNTRVWRCIMGISWFWLVGATFLSQFPTYAKDVLHADETVVTMFLVAFSLGIGAGSLLCNMLLKGKVSSAYAPWAAFGITLFTIDLFFASANVVMAGEGIMNVGIFLAHAANWRILLDLCGVAICGGVFVVPLYAIIQHDSEPESRARTIASNNVINALFMVAAAIGTVAMLDASFTVPEVFLTMAILNVPVAFYTMRIRRKYAAS
jgi:acyl-[acyl-carrier-protein]-phospholipid O-acyltransferase / long-chain-fatty-acid--[acyl-carrier-protein] ligase